MENEEHFEGKIALKAIIERGGKVFLVRDPRLKELIWEIPGGRMNVDEVPQKALQREIKEELGIECFVKEVVYMTQFLQGSEGKRAFVIVCRAETEAEEKDFTFDDREVCETGWFTLAEALSLPLFTEYKEALEIYNNQSSKW